MAREHIVDKLQIYIPSQLMAAVKAEKKRRREIDGAFVGYTPIVIDALRNYFGLEGNGKRPNGSRGSRGKRVAA